MGIHVPEKGLWVEVVMAYYGVDVALVGDVPC
jgi:hypothetical protein